MSDFLRDTVPARRNVTGFLASYKCWHQGSVELVDRKPNQIQLGWGQIIVRCLMGKPEFRLRGMYIEFQNTAGSSVSESLTNPTYDPEEGIEYYEDLALTDDRDFLRVPLASEPSQRISSGLESYFADDGTEGNTIRLFAQTQGTTGVHGRSFSLAAGSVVVGAALVAVPDWTDRQQDWVFSRSYLALDKQLEASDRYSVGLGWDLSFLPE